MILKANCPVHLGCLAASLAALQSQPKLAPDDAKCPRKTMALRMEVMLCTLDCLSGPSGCYSPGQGGEAGGRCIQAGTRGPERPESEENPHPSQSVSPRPGQSRKAAP